MPCPSAFRQTFPDMVLVSGVRRGNFPDNVFVSVGLRAGGDFFMQHGKEDSWNEDDNDDVD